MPTSLKPFFYNEMEAYQVQVKKANFSLAWKHLERAHVIGQAFPMAHTRVHWLMLRFGIKTKERNEILGQLPRLMLGGIKSFVGNIPVGNTGGANVPPLKPMPIPEELQQILNTYK